MNVKAGQMAYIVDDGPYAGRVVKIDKFYGDAHGYPNCWWVSAQWEMECMNGRYDNEFLFPDARLRPISGVPVHDEQHDEVPA